MKKKRTPWLVLVLSVAGVIALAFLAANEANAQNQTVDDLLQHLKRQGVPVTSITIQSRIPFQVAVVLQSSSDSTILTTSDLWFAQLARREVSLAKRVGLGISKYKLTWLNTSGQVITWEDNTLGSNHPAQWATPLPPPKLSNDATAQLIRAQMDLRGMTLEVLDIVPNTGMGNNGQNLIMQLSVPDLTAANKAVRSFLSRLPAFLDTLNSKNGTSIVICWVRLNDRQGKLLLNYVWDVETRTETSTKVAGLKPWYPVPPGLSQTPYPGP